MAEERERWGTRIGLILAAAGNAIGIGNLLRFPSQAAQNGGGAFMIPYVVCLLVFGLPMMWIAWTIGRYGGRFGHTSLPGIFDRLWKNRVAKYLGVLGLALPMIFCLYYTYIEAWCLAYSYFSLTGEYVSTAGRTVELPVFYNEFLGNATSHTYFSGLSTAFIFLVITLGMNVWVLARGVSRGIELLAKIAIPLLVLFCIMLSVRVLTMDPVQGSASDGLSFLWSPDFSALSKPGVWMAAAGQIFFTLSIGFGSLECYASYVREKEDVALAGLTTAATNEFVEVIFGSMIAIPAAAIFFGPAMIGEIAASGGFAIGMISMPEILRSIPGVHFFGTIWFLLLFFAAFTSSVGVCQPIMAFLQDEAKLKRGSAAAVVGLVWFLGSIPVIFFYKYGLFDEFDYWAGTVGLVVMALIEVLIFVLAFGLKKGWDELHEGALIRVPRFFKFVIKYVTPVALAFIFVMWVRDRVVTPDISRETAILWNVAERATYEGDFKKDTPASESPEGKEFAQMESSVREAIRTAGRDLSAWADVDLGSDGSIQVTSFSADPRLEKVFGAEQLQHWLQLQKYRYELKGSMQATSIAINLEGVDRKPYLSLARVIIAVFVLAFAVFIGVVWKQKEKEAVA